MNESTRASARKRLMFIAGEDFYYLTYNSLLLLDSLDCTKPDTRFRDYRKLAYLVDFVADERLCGILTRHRGQGKIGNSFDHHLILSAYARGTPRVNLLSRLTYALEQRGILTTIVEPEQQATSLTVDRDKLRELVSSVHFEKERQNALALAKVYNRVRSAGLDTLLDKLFYAYGVGSWGA